MCVCLWGNVGGDVCMGVGVGGCILYVCACVCMCMCACVCIYLCVLLQLLVQEISKHGA